MSRRRDEWQVAVDNLLAEWGRWSRVAGLQHLGYPSMSSHHKMRRRIGLEGTPPAPVSDAQAEWVDAAIRKLPGDLQAVVKQKHLWESVDHDGARRLSLGVTAYRHRLAVAHAYLAGLLQVESSV